VHVRSPDELENALREAIARNLPACVNVAIAGEGAPIFSAAAATP
jgi:thiamine pyrophosphate-dependent acetolactate synthase large subunit-like protein